MVNMNLWEKLKSALRENDLEDEWSDIADDICGSSSARVQEWDDEAKRKTCLQKLIDKLELSMTIRCEDGYGGEGGGDDYWGVFSLEIPGTPKEYYRISGSYASFVGPEVDAWDVEHVEPFLKTVTDWRKKRE